MFFLNFLVRKILFVSICKLHNFKKKRGTLLRRALPLPIHKNSFENKTGNKTRPHETISADRILLTSIKVLCHIFCLHRRLQALKKPKEERYWHVGSILTLVYYIECIIIEYTERESIILQSRRLN